MMNLIFIITFVLLAIFTLFIAWRISDKVQTTFVYITLTCGIMVFINAFF